MGMKIIREDMGTGKKEEVAGFGSINLQIGNGFIEDAARNEAKGTRNEVSIANVKLDDCTIRHSVVISNPTGLPLAHFYGEWNDETGDLDD